MTWRATLRRSVVALLVLMPSLGWLGPSSARAESADSYEASQSVVADRKNDQIQPRVHGDWVVWKDYRNLPSRSVDGSPNGQIYGFNRETEAELQLSSTNDSGDPAISGTVVVWTEGRDRGNGIFGTYLDTGEVFRVSDARGHQQYPAVSGSVVVWQDNREGNWDVYGYDLEASKEFPLVEQNEDQTRPAISGRTVVWEDWRDRKAGPDIFAFDLETRKSTRLTSNHDAYQPAVSDRWVVWVGKAEQAVFARNLGKDKTIRLSSAAGPKGRPAISGELVVWADERNGDSDIYGYDLETGVEFPILIRDEPQTDPDIHGATVVWSDGRGRNHDVIAAQLTGPREFVPAKEVLATRESTQTISSPAALVVTPPTTVISLRVAGTDGSGLILRSAPSETADQVNLLPEGAILTAVGQPQHADGRAWYPVRDPDGLTGWVAAEYVLPIS
jgi:beta propeller repeat protein